MENSGCKACPAYAKCTAKYRGSACAAMRDSYGLGDPKTHYDEIRAMNIEEMADWHKKMMEGYCPRPTSECPNDCYACWLDWLKQEVEDGR